MQYTLLEGQWLTLSKHLKHGRGDYLKNYQKASVCSVKADECTDITAVEELSVFCCWEEEGTPVDAFWTLCL